MTVAVQVTSFGTPTLTRATSGSVTGSWGSGQNRTAGDVLVAIVTAGGSTASAAALSTPSGWTQQAVISNTATTANAWAAVYTKVAAGSDSSPAFTATLSGTAAMTCTLLELAAANCTYTVDTYGTYASGGSAGSLTSMSATTTAALQAAGEYAIGVFVQEAAAATNTWTPGTSWTNLASDGTTSTVLHTAVDYYANPASGSTLNEAGSWSAHASAFGAGIVISFAPAGAIELFTDDAATTISSGGTDAPASGTPELWTATSWSGFPVASPTASPPTMFHVADPAVPGELIAVLNTSTGLVVRGAEGTTPVAHTTGFSVQNVVTAGFLNGVAGLQPSGDTTGATDTANLQGLLNLGGKALAGRGTFYLSSAGLKMTSGMSLAGAGQLSTYFSQAHTAANAITITGPGVISNIQVQDLWITGPGSGSGIGISAAAGGTDNPVEQLVLRNLTIQDMGSHGVYALVPIVSVFDNVVSQLNGGRGFYITGVPASGSETPGTSCVFNACYANDNALDGYYLQDLTYSTLNACAADSNATGYIIAGCEGLTLNSCGAESTTAKNSLDGTSFKITEDSSANSSTGITLNGCYVLVNNAVGYWVTETSNNVALIGCIENGPGGSATASIKTDSGTNSVIMGYSVETGLALTAGTYTLLNDGTTGLVTLGGSFALNQVTSAQTISGNGATIDTAGVGVACVTTSAARTGAILQAGTVPGQMVTVINQSASADSVTFAASGTSNVADGTSDVIAGVTARTFTWDSLTSLWYRSG